MNARCVPLSLAMAAWLVSLGMMAYATELSVGHVTVGVGESVAIPIYIRGVADLSSVNITFAYDPEIVQIDAVKKGEVVDNFLIAYHVPQPGELRIALASARSVVGDGVLIYVHMRVVEGNAGGQQSTLHLSDARLNGSEIPTLTVDGVLTVRGSVAVRRQGRYRAMWAQFR